MNEKFMFINAANDEPVKEDSFTGMLGTLSGKTTECTGSFETTLTMEKLEKMMELFSTPARSKSPFLSAFLTEFDFRPQFKIDDENQKPDHSYRMMMHPSPVQHSPIFPTSV